MRESAASSLHNEDAVARWQITRGRDVRLLARQAEYARNQSALYSDKLAGVDISPDALASGEGLDAVGFTEKAELVQTQTAGDLFSANLSCSPDRVVLVQGTGGTSGTILRLPFTRADIRSYAETGARAFLVAGLQAGTPVLMSLNYHLYAGGFADHRAVERAGGMAVPIGIGNTARLAKLLHELPRKAQLYATPSYARHLLESDEAARFRESGWPLELVILSGEAGAANPTIRAELEARFGAPIRDYFGVAELGAQAAECDQLSGLHWCGSSHTFFEVVDPETERSLPIVPGVRGELVMSTLAREAAPLIRLRTHDTVEILGFSCACGRDGLRFRVLGRVDDLLVVRGINLYPQAVEEVLIASALPVTRTFEIQVKEPPPSSRPLTLVVESNAHDSASAESVAEQVKQLCKMHLNVTFEVVVAAPGSLPRDHHKARRVRFLDQ
jgi:phenylacetate-CoA ligase